MEPARSRKSLKCARQPWSCDRVLLDGLEREALHTIQTNARADDAFIDDLVVDDDPELRQMVGTYLIDQGYEVRCLCDARQMEARLEFQRPISLCSI